MYSTLNHDSTQNSSDAVAFHMKDLTKWRPSWIFQDSEKSHHERILIFVDFDHTNIFESKMAKNGDGTSYLIKFSLRHSVEMLILIL